MLLWLEYRWQLWWLNSEMRAARKRLDSAVRVAKKNGATASDITQVEGEYIQEVFYVEDRIAEVLSTYLMRRAHQLCIPTAEHNDASAWDDSFGTSKRHLKTEALFNLRSQIRAEQSARWQFWESRIKGVVWFLTVLTGAVGSLIGLIATWRK